jgi:hypothetical protein
MGARYAARLTRSGEIRLDGASLPLVARHSGLAEVAAALEEVGVPGRIRVRKRRRPRGEAAGLLARPADERAELAARARRVAEERWSWAHVVDRLLQPFT